MLSDVVKFTLCEKGTAGGIHYMTLTIKRHMKHTVVSFFMVYLFIFTFKLKSMEDEETLGDDTMEYSISAYLSTLAKTAVRQKVSQLFNINKVFKLLS